MEWQTKSAFGVGRLNGSFYWQKGRGSHKLLSKRVHWSRSSKPELSSIHWWRCHYWASVILRALYLNYCSPKEFLEIKPCRRSMCICAKYVSHVKEMHEGHEGISCGDFRKSLETDFYLTHESVSLLCLHAFPALFCLSVMAVTSSWYLRGC